jgi:hypothetical protein
MACWPPSRQFDKDVRSDRTREMRAALGDAI